MKVTYAAHTDVGQQRQNNEDNFFVLPDHHLYIVADGMGGHACGEVASLAAVETLANFFIASAVNEIADWPFTLDETHTYDEKRLATGIKLANQQIYETSMEDESKQGMGTTVVAMLLGKSCAYIAHVGDSRGYRISNGNIRQITADHSLVNEFLKAGRLTPEEAKDFAHKNVIVRALGLGGEIEVDVLRAMPEPGDLFLLCSDGLSDMLDDETILTVISESNGELSQTASALADKANEAGGIDNITIVLVKFFD